MEISFQVLGLVTFALAVGGVLKGATGAGAPVVVVPLLALLYDVRFAVVVYIVPNIVSNLVQLWRNRSFHLPQHFSLLFCLSGSLGAVLGTSMLVSLSSEALMGGVAVAVFAYVGFRLTRPEWSLGQRLASRLVLPVGLAAGTLQGTSGISAPISITFLNAMQLDRPQFMATISAFFVGVGVVQLVTLGALGWLGPEQFVYSCLATIPLLCFMPVGNFLVRFISRKTFDKVILVLLFMLALRLSVAAFLA